MKRATAEARQKMLEAINLDGLRDMEQARECLVKLLNLVEELAGENQELRGEVQRLRDEINRLNGEQGKPKVKPNRATAVAAETNHSSERERRKPKEWKKGKKVEKVKIDREEVLEVDRAVLPADAEFKGYEEVVVQDVKIETDNVRFLKEKWYSAWAGKTYLAEMPAGYEGEFGPGIKALVLVLYYAGNMTGPKILELLAAVGVHLSKGQMSNLLIKKHHRFHQEKEAVYEAGLGSSPWQHVDETGTRVNGQNQHCHIVCTPLYTAYFTTEKKDRLTVLDVLRNFRERKYRLNEEAYRLLEVFKLPGWVVQPLKEWPPEVELSEAEFSDLLKRQVPGLGPNQRRRVLEAAGVAAYHADMEFPVVQLMMVDDAPQFKWLTEELALCWVHEGRHYKKLQPYVGHHRQVLEEFREKFWSFYEQLLAYREDPTAVKRQRLASEFDDLFSTVTGYEALDQRMAKTKSKKEALLMALSHPEIPLHNNPAELGARQRVRKRSVSGGPRTEEGKQAWDTFMTLVATATKLAVSVYHYIHDRVSETYQMPSLADLIAERAEQHPLGSSWEPP